MDIEIRIIIRGVGSDVTVETHQVSDEAQQFVEETETCQRNEEEVSVEADDEQVDKVFA